MRGFLKVAITLRVMSGGTRSSGENHRFRSSWPLRFRRTTAAEAATNKMHEVRFAEIADVILRFIGSLVTRRAAVFEENGRAPA
jgi:hypothetical protein